MRIFSWVEPQTESTFPFQYNIICETYQSLEPLAPFQEKVDMCAYWLLCMEFNAQQLLYRTFPHTIHIFGPIEPPTESTFPFQYYVMY